MVDVVALWFSRGGEAAVGTVVFPPLDSLVGLVVAIVVPFDMEDYRVRYEPRYM